MDVMTFPSSPMVPAAASDGPALLPAHIITAGVALGLTIGLVALFIAVLVSILRSSLGAGVKILWVIFVFCVPVLAWFAWFLLGRPDARRDGTPW